MNVNTVEPAGELLLSATPVRKTLAPVKAAAKLLVAGDSEYYIRGVTYGPFRPDPDGCEYHNPSRVGDDFARMAAAGVNTVRVYTVPPLWLLDAALDHGLRVMVGLPWEQHIAFLDDPGRPEAIEQRIREGVRSCAGHPAVLCFVIGNEIPASIVRWHGRRRIERFLHRLYRSAKSIAPQTLVTYVNFPTTEYLRLAFLDFICFNVYLEDRELLEAYVARLQNLAGDLPLVLAEAGLDSRRNGVDKQAATLEWQVEAAFAQGCAGIFVFAWTDEWHRGGHDIEDWDFGLVTRGRRPKPALAAVQQAFASVPFRSAHDAWPSVSVVICTYNGGRTIAETLRRASELDYPNYELIVVNDGSTDGTADVVRSFPRVRLINQANGGLSCARNTGMRAATGEIVAYLDDDAYPVRNWLYYVAYAFRDPRHAAVGGPNLPPPGDGWVSACVANAPGGPRHVLLTDTVAEHIPGCNFSVRKACLEAVGGFDPVYRVAGDDVDVCWKLQDRGWTLGFHPAAMVWHHRRNSVRAYLRQQTGYGRAEALLEKRWPRKYNLLGHVDWIGRVYGGGMLRAIGPRWRIYHGTWGSAPFQSLYEPAPTLMQLLPQTPEWHLWIILLGLLSLFGIWWRPLLLTSPLLVAVVLLSLAQIAASAAKAEFRDPPNASWKRLALYGLTAVLFALQPLARLRGRLGFGLTPWRHTSSAGCRTPQRMEASVWSEVWRAPEEWLTSLERFLQDHAPAVHRGDDFDCWDLHVRCGLLAGVRLRMAVEEHGSGKQLLRFCADPRIHWCAPFASYLCAGLSVFAAAGGAWIVALLLFGLAFLVMRFVSQEWALAHASLSGALDRLRSEASETGSNGQGTAAGGS